MYMWSRSRYCDIFEILGAVSFLSLPAWTLVSLSLPAWTFDRTIRLLENEGSPDRYWQTLHGNGL
jgi:hypothetical protein